jgi:hypothetical protein
MITFSIACLSCGAGRHLTRFGWVPARIPVFAEAKKITAKADFLPGGGKRTPGTDTDAMHVMS